MVSADPRPRGAIRLLLAAGTSSYGDWLTTVVLVVVLYRITNSPTGPALYFLARTLPRVFGPLPGGSLADRFGPAQVAATCVFLQAALTVGLIFAVHAQLIFAIYLLVAASQFLTSLAAPAYTAIIPRLTTPLNLGRIQGIYSGLFSSSILVGPALGALLLPRLTPELLIGADAATFLFAGILLLTLLGIKAQPGAPAKKGILTALPLVWHDPTLRFLAAAYLANSALITTLQAVLVDAAATHFGAATNVGWLYAAVGLGALLGALPVIRKTPAKVTRRPLILASALELVPLCFFVFVTNLPLAAGLLLLSSIGGVLYQTRGTVGLQQRIAPALLGRATGLIRFALYLGMLIGSLFAVLLAHLIGWQATVLTAFAFSALLLILVTLTDRGTTTIPS